MYFDFYSAIKVIISQLFKWFHRTENQHYKLLIVEKRLILHVLNYMCIVETLEFTVFYCHFFTVWDRLNSYRTSSLLTGWWLSMDSKDSFLEKLQPLHDLPNVLDKRHRFARDYKDPEKTLGFILVRLLTNLYFSFCYM